MNRVFTFHSVDGELLDTQDDLSRSRAKSHAGFLATQYGPITVKEDGNYLTEIGETYLDGKF